MNSSRSSEHERSPHVADPEVVAAFAALHTDVTHVLRRWIAPDAQQEARRTAYLAHLDEHPDAVAKAGPGAHLTASCLVLDASGEHVLLTHHKRAGQWFQFGGHLEPGDGSVLGSATREAREESGLDHLSPAPTPVQLDRHVLVGDFGACREHLDIRYAALAPGRSTPRVSAESHDVRWWPVAALPGGTAGELHPLVSASRRALGLCAD